MAEETRFSGTATQHVQIKNWVVFETITGYGNSKKKKKTEKINDLFKKDFCMLVCSLILLPDASSTL
jgi:hypothetical protein